MKPRRVVILAFPRVQLLDVAGPYEVLHTASRLVAGAYEVQLAAAAGTPPVSSSGLALVPHMALDEPLGALDTLIVAGGNGVREAERDEQLIAWLREASTRARRTASVCSGAFLLARAGLLDGRRATTHWASCAALAERYPSVAVEPEPIFVRDDHVYTSAGVTAGMDLALALVEEDLGRRTALEVARWLVLFVKRPGGQSQFSAHLSTQLAEREPLRELQAYIAEHPGEDLSVAALARRDSMSERNFARAFRREIGVTPAAYVEGVRVEQARMALESTGEPIDAIARRCGFGTPETMRRAFHRRLHVAPGDYRGRFRAAA